MLQRLAMCGVALGPMLNLRFGSRGEHYGLALLACIFGGAVSLRQITLHVCPGFPTFGEPVFGLSLYTWAFLVFAVSVFAIACILFFHVDRKREELNVLEKGIIGLALLVTFSNVITTLLECGLGACKG